MISCTSGRVETEMHSLNVPDVFSWSRTYKTKYEDALWYFQKEEDNPKFVINETEVETVSHYKYLGVNISHTGTFIVAEKNLSLNASRALFSIKQGVFNNNVKLSVIFRIFDSLVKPIALYGSEVWFGYKNSFHNKTIDQTFEMSFKGYNEFDKTFTRFCKYILGVHSKTSNFAVTVN